MLTLLLGMNILVVLSVLPVIYVLAVFIFIIYPLFFGAPYEPTDKKTLKNMIRLGKPLKGRRVADLGSGDGRLVIELARQGAEAHGFEINPILVYLSRWKIKKLGLQDKAFIHYKNFWKTNFSGYGVIFIFQISYLMPKLESKLKKEFLGKIVSNKWVFKNLKMKRRIGRARLYEIKTPATGFEA
jgi:SAM-dependent methyltransferase